MTKAELIDEVSRVGRIPRKDSEAIVDVIFRNVAHGLTASKENAEEGVKRVYELDELLLVERAQAVIGVERLSEWMQTPLSALGGRTPYSLLASAEGRKQVEILLGRIEHGVY
jgi:uncharacterized protein (DUF2384 family)